MAPEILQDENVWLRVVCYPCEALYWMLNYTGKVSPSELSHSLHQVLGVIPAEWFSGNCPWFKGAALVKTNDPPWGQLTSKDSLMLGCKTLILLPQFGTF